MDLFKKGYEGKEFENVVVYDVNSLYPYVMSENIFPFGAPIITHDLEEIAGYSLLLLSLNVNFG